MKMKKVLVILLGVFILICGIQAQVKKQLVTIKLSEKERIDFKYNYKNQLISFIETGVISLYQYNFKYDKDGCLIECNIVRDKGDVNITSKYNYAQASKAENAYVMEEMTISGRLATKNTENNKIYIDANQRIENVFLDNGTPWENFEYDNDGNLIKYTLHIDTKGKVSTISYLYDNHISPLTNITLPTWFWANHISNLKWSGEFIGKNNASSSTSEVSREEPIGINITYEYDNDNYPIKQYYNGNLSKEFTYKVIK